MLLEAKEWLCKLRQCFIA